MLPRESKHHISTLKGDENKSTYDRLAEITAYQGGKCNINYNGII
jgi:hypothetical protein